ncbi:MAG: large repetitive protein, partial [bacterium]
TASDVSTIKAGTGSGALAAAVGAVGVAMTVGVSIARNEISNEVRAYIQNADTGVTTNGSGAIVLSATESASITANATAVSAAASLGLVGVSFAGAGADARNVILTKTDAYIAASTVTSGGAVSIGATDTGLTVSAEILSVAVALGVGVFSGALAIGVGISQNFIGWDPSPTSSATFTTDSTPASVSNGQTVKINGGAHLGDVYSYVGSSTLIGSPDLHKQDYSNTSLWQQVKGTDVAEVKAYVSGSSLTASGALSIMATASETITALVNTDSVALAGSLVGAVSAAGAGTTVVNRIGTVVQAYITSTPTGKQVKATSITISATDTATITATANAVAVAAAFGLAGSAAVSVAVALADNEISGAIEAFVSSANVATTAGAMSITATSTASNTGTASAVAVSASFSLGSLSLSGGGARVDTTTRTSTKAYVSASTLDIAGALSVSADATATTTKATVLATSVSVGILSFAFAVNPTTVVTLEPTVEASLQSSSVTAAGSISLIAGAATAATAKTEGNSFTGGLVAVSGAGSDATATTTPSIKAYISGASSSTTSESGSISVLALLGVSAANARRGGDTRAEAQAASVAVGLGGAGAGATASATSAGAVDSSADGALSASNAITIRGKAIRSASADAKGSAGGLVGVGKSNSFATANGSANAQLFGSVGGATDVTVQAISTDAANATSKAVSGGLVADTDNGATATASPTVSASIESSGHVDLSGALTVEASAYPEADGSTRGVAGGLIGVGGSTTSTVVSPTVTATVSAPASAPASPPAIHAGTVVVLAQATPQTDAVVPDFRIVSTDTTADTLRILSSGLQTGEAVEYEPGANALIGGLVSTYVDTSLGSSVTLRRAYNILSVYTTTGDLDPDNVALGNLFASGAIDGSRDRITFNFAHNFLPGDEVIYHRGQGSTTGVGGLTEGATYYVLVVDERTIELTTTQAAAVTPGLNLKPFAPGNVTSNTINLTGNGFAPGQAVTYRAPASATFLGAQVAVDESFVGDPAELKLTTNDTKHNIYFVNAVTGAQQAHGFTDGETVDYHVSGGTAIGGLTDGAAYRVRSLSSYDIALRPVTTGSVSLTFAKNGGSPDTITRGDGLSWASFGYQAGMQFTIAGDTTSGSGTVNVNGTYTIVTVSGTAVTVAAVGADRTFTGSITAASDIPIAVTAADRRSAAIHRLTRPTEEPISSLVDGITYYVYRPTGMSADNFQLVATKTGTTPLTLGTTGLGATVVHKIGVESVDIDALTCGSTVNCDQTLRINITGGVAGNQFLTGPGGVSLATISPPVGDGASSATSTGSGGGFVGVGSNTATITANPTVKADVTAALITATGDVSITSASVTKTTVSSKNGSGGFVAVGSAHAHSFQTNKSSVSVGAATRIIAGGSFTLQASATSQTDASSRANAGGAIGIAHSDTDASIDYLTSATIGAGVDVQAADLVKVSSLSTTKASTNSFADGRGFGADGDSGADTSIGKGANGAKTTVSVGANTALVAKRLLLEARVPQIRATAHGEAYGAGFYSEGDDDSSLNIDASDSVTIGANAVITGWEGVDVSTRYDDVNDGVGNTVDSFARSTGLFGHVEADADNNSDLTSTFTSAAGATITAGPRDPDDPVLKHPDSTDLDRLAFFVDNANGPLSAQRDGHVSKRSLASGGGHEGGHGIKTTPSIDFDSNVVILSGRSPLLIVNSCGSGCATIATAINVTVWDGAGSPAKTTGVISSSTIYVNDIVNRTPGQVFFRTDKDHSDNGSIGGGESAHSIASSGTWEFRGGFQQVVIVNNSDKPLEVHNIRVFNDPSDALSKPPLVRLEAIDDGHITLTFNLTRTIAPSLVRIQSTNAAATATITLAGMIDNPIGTTVVQNLGGAGVLSSAARDTSSTSADGVARIALVRTNVLDLESATKSVGAAATRVNVDVVDVAGRPAATSFATGRVSSATDTIYIGQHAFFSGQAVRYHATSTAITGLTNDAVYVVIVVDAQQIQLASTSNPTTPLGLDTAGLSASALHTLTPVQRFTAVTPSGSIYLDVKGRLRDASVTDYEVVVDAVRAGVDADLLLQAATREVRVSGTNGGVLVQHPGEGSGETHYTFYNTPDPSGSALPDVGVFGACDLADQTACPEIIETTYLLKALDQAGARTLAGVQAGGNIILKAAPFASATPLVHIDGILEIHGTGTDTEGAGWIDALTNGQITLAEKTDNLHVGHIESRFGDVTLGAPRAILDWHSVSGEVADVVAVNLTMTAGTGLVSGGIGTPDNFLEIDVDALDGSPAGVLKAYDTSVPTATTAAQLAACGTLSSTATCGVFLTDTHANLPVHTVDTKGDASLVTTAGSIVDGLHTTGTTADGAEVFANSIDLRAGGGSIGTSSNDIEIDSQYRVGGDVGLQADVDVYVTEVDGTLRLVLAEAIAGDVRITVRESDPDASPSAATLDEDLDLLRDGSVRFDEGVLRAVTRGRIAALAGTVLLRAGDDVTTSPNSEIRAGKSIDIYGDWTNADAGYGTTIILRGDIVPGALFKTRVWGDTDVDVFQFGDPSGVGGATTVGSDGYVKLGGNTRVYGSQDESAAEPDGEDAFTVYYLQTMNVGAGHTLTLDGQAETDTYDIYSTGSRGSARNYVINVLDTGAPDDGVDTVTIYGADSTQNGNSAPATPYPTDDIFLLRRVTAIALETADRPAFVALAHTTLAVAAPSGQALLPAGAFDVEKINYDTAINGRLTVLGRGGNDFFASDDNSAITTLDGGLGDDTFQVGQIYGLKRDALEYAGTVGDTSGGSLVANEVFATVATTRGWVSAGVSQSLLAKGGSGDDTFVVYANQAPLRLEGDDDNDQFIVRAFALAETTGTCDGPAAVNDPSCQIVWRDAANQVAMPRLTSGFSTAAETDIRTGAGQNQVQYAINAPVSIDGGNGIDKVVVLGTEFADHIVVTEKAIYGAGLAVTYANVEILEVDGLEGDDSFDVLSTAPGVATRIVGGLGSDTINVAGDVAGDVVSRDIEGTSGAINHDVRSTDPLYDGIVAGGVDVSVARATQGQVIIEESAGFTDVREGGAADTYLVYLAARPTANVYVTVSAARSPQQEQPGGDSFLVSETPPTIAAVDFDRDIVIDGQTVHVPKRAIVLVFTPDAWAKTGQPQAGAQTVSLIAVDDTLAEGDRVAVASHSVISADPAFDHAVVRNVEVTIHDDDLASIQVVQLDPAFAADNTTLVVEGTPTTELVDTFDVRLSIMPSGTVTVELRPSDDRVVLSGPTGRFTTVTPRSAGIAGVYRVTLDAGNWASGVRVTVHGANDFTRQDPHNTQIDLSIVQAQTVADFDAALAARVYALVVDDDTAGVVVIESAGNTRVVAGDTTNGPGPGDSYQLRLTLRPDGTVTTALVTDGQTDIVTGGRIGLQAIGGQVALQQFLGDIGVSGTVLTRVNDSALGNFRDEGFAAGQLIRISNAGAASGDRTIASVSLDGLSLTLTSAPAAGVYSGAIISRLVTKGLFSGGVAYDATAGTLTRTDATSWLDDGFLEGQLIQVGSDAAIYKIESITGTTSSRLDVLKLTDKAKPVGGSVPASVTVTQWAAVVTFDATNWYQPVTVPLVADPWFDLAPGRENLKSFSKRRHLLSGLRGPLAVEGGPTAADRSLRSAVLLPGEGNGPLFRVAPQPPESQQVDTLNVFTDSSQEDLVGTLTATALSGLNMSGPLDFSALIPGGGTMPFGDPVSYPGGISFGTITFVGGKFVTDAATSTIEVLNVLLGEGNDQLTIASTLVGGPDPSTGIVAVHGGITTVHGGGNSRLEVRGNFTVAGANVTRTDGVSWASAGFAVGQQVTIAGAPAGTVTALSGSAMTLSSAPATAATLTDAIVAVRDPKTLATRIGGDRITVTGGGGPASPLVVYGDTSQDGVWYSGDPRQQSIRDFGIKPFPSEVGNGTPHFFFP